MPPKPIIEDRPVEIDGKDVTYTLRIQRTAHNKRLRAVIIFDGKVVEGFGSEDAKDKDAVKALQEEADSRFSFLYKDLNK